MSRLDGLLRRLEAQAACLRHGARLIAGCPGAVLELGLGHGRTHDHLCRLFPDRPVYVFERRRGARAAACVSEDRLFLGDIRDTLAAARDRIGGAAALAHCDLGSGHAARDRALACWLGPVLATVMMNRGIVISDQALGADGLDALPLPPDVPIGRYHLYQVRGVHAIARRGARPSGVCTGRP